MLEGDLRVNGRRNIIYEIDLQRRYAGPFSIHHFDRPISHRLFQVALREEFPVDKQLQEEGNWTKDEKINI